MRVALGGRRSVGGTIRAATHSGRRLTKLGRHAFRMAAAASPSRAGRRASDNLQEDVLDATMNHGGHTNR
jgi:hypothetical protein